MSMSYHYDSLKAQTQSGNLYAEPHCAFSLPLECLN